MCTAQRAEFRSCQFTTPPTPSVIRKSIRNGSKRSGGRTAAKQRGIGSRRWWTKLVAASWSLPTRFSRIGTRSSLPTPLGGPHHIGESRADFDHGKTNPTALLRAYIDGDGVIYFCGEYYVAGKE